MARADLGLIESWDGTKWSVVPSPNPTFGSSDSLSSVSCATPSFCVTVGNISTNEGTQTFVESWNGAAWTIDPMPSDGVAGELYSVSCTSWNACVAVGTSGYYQNATLIEAWDGTTWSIASPPAVPSATGEYLSGVSCTSDHGHHNRGLAGAFCSAVGSYSGAPEGLQTLVEAWDGTTWSFIPSPNVPFVQADDNQLTEVSCSSSVACTAVGTFYIQPYDFNKEAELMETWNGTAWSITPSPDPSPTGNHMTGVSCSRPTRCVAVGWTGLPAVPLIYLWDGTTWTTSTSSANNAALFSVSCIRAYRCMAVGASPYSSIEGGLILSSLPSANS